MPMFERNPFPGMNPWMERYWDSLHYDYIHHCRHQIAAQLPPDLYCRVEETVYVVEADPGKRKYRPDVSVFRSRAAVLSSSEGTADPAASVGLATPVLWRPPSGSTTQLHINILSTRSKQPLVTAIEVISPTNKLDRFGRKQYLRKREDYVEANASLVEIDLIRDGEPIVGPSADVLPEVYRTPYLANVRRALTSEDVEAEAELYPLPLRQRLPRISIPLRPVDEDIVLDLQSPLDQAYTEGRYGLEIDYSMPPKPPLSPEDAAWAAELLASARGKTSALPSNPEPTI
jgi:hypothetical protein